MKSKIQTNYVEPYYQVPKIVSEFCKMTNDHIIIFMHLYDQLRQRKEWNKSNHELAVLSRVSETTLKRRLNDLESWEFIIRQGMGFNRKFRLGLKFDNRATVTLSKIIQGHSGPDQGQNCTSTGSTVAYIDKNSLKNIINSSAHAIKNSKPKMQHPPPTLEQQTLIQNYQYGLKFPQFQLKGIELNTAIVLHKRYNNHS